MPVTLQSWVRIIPSKNNIEVLKFYELLPKTEFPPTLISRTV